MEMLNSGTPLTREYISELEKQLNINLPEDYVQFILEHNGGSPKEDWLFDFADGVLGAKNTSTIRDFFKIYTEAGKTSYDDFVKICRIMWSEGTLGENMIAIADDPGGNPICMCVAGDDFGKVYMANHEFEDADTGYLYMDEMAPSFTAFLNMLYKAN